MRREQRAFRNPNRGGGRRNESRRHARTGDAGPEGPAVEAERGQHPHQREPRLRHSAQGVLDSACALTEARYGLLTPFDDDGDIRMEEAFGFGMTPSEVAAPRDMLTGSEFQVR